MRPQAETLSSPFATYGLHDVLEAAGNIPVHESLGAATDRLEAVVAGLRDLMQDPAVTQHATLVFYAAESALALVYASHAGVDPEMEGAPQNSTSPERGAPPVEGPCRTVGERLVLARAWAGLTQSKLAKKIGIEQASISQLERGESQRSTYVAEMARACGVSTDWLAFGSEASA